MDSKLDGKLLYTSQVLKDLSTAFVPHPGQIDIGKALFYDNKKRVLVQCGRKYGKTHFLIYSLYRWCLMYPNSWCYYIAPLKDQISDLIWMNGRMPNFLSDKLMKKYGITVNNTDKRVIFQNGSYIKCEGSDSYEKSRGYSATGLCVYDELKDLHPKFHEGFEPNLGITDAPLLMVGTPPSEDEDGFERWVSMANEVKSSPVGFYINRPSMTNPHISKEFFERKYKEFKAKGELWRWEKEYMAQYVRASSMAIFPMLDRDIHVKPHVELMREVLNSHHDWNFHVAFDPGSAKCFAVIFAVVNKYSKRVIVLDEIYATSFSTNSVGVIIEEVKSKLFAIMPEVDRWSGVYDYAATWFWNEYQQNYDFGLFINKCEKDLKNKDVKLSMIKDMLIGGHLVFSDKCEKLFWEMSKYATEENGKLKKENDHAIDAFRYLLNDANYSLLPGERAPTEEETHKHRRKITIQEDLQELSGGDIYGSIDSELFDY